MKKATIILILMLIILPISFCLAKEEPSYSIVDFSSMYGYRIAMDNLGKETYIDEEGVPLMEFKFDGCFAFSAQGYALAFTEDENGRRNKFYSIDAQGNIDEFDPALGMVDYYDGEFGIVSIPSGDPVNPVRSALIDASKNLITDYDNNGIYYRNGIIRIQKGELEGVLDSKGNIIIPIEYLYISNTYTGTNDKGVTDSTDNILSTSKRNDDGTISYGYIRNDGQIMLPCEYDGASVFQNGYGMLERGEKWAVIDTMGTMITDFQYDLLFPYMEGLAIVKIDNNYGCIDTKGNMIIPCIYQEIGTRIENGYVPVYRHEDDVVAQEPRLIPNPLINQRGINIYLNDSWLYTDIEPIISNNRTLAPLRAITEALGYTVQWNQSDQTVIIQNNEQILQLIINSKEVRVNTFDDGQGPETILLDVPAQIINGRTLVPVRFLAENTGAEVIWEQDTKTIIINTAQ